MTIEEMVFDVWDGAGRPTNLDPTDATDESQIDMTKPETKKIIKALNMAQQRVVSWKDGKFTQRFMLWSGAFHHVIMKLEGSSEIGQIGSTSAQFLKDPSGDFINQNYEGYVAILGDEVRDIVADTGNSFIVNPSFSTIMENENVVVRPLGYTIPDKNMIKSVQQVYVQETGNQIFLAPREERFVTGSYNLGEPSEYFVKGKSLYFNNVPESDLFVKVVVEKMPYSLKMMGKDEESEIPPQYHIGVVLYALGWAHGIMQEESRRIAYQTEFRDFMRETIGEQDMENSMNAGDRIRLERMD